MNVSEKFNFDNDYRNSDYQQTATITLPGAIMALSDMSGTLADALQRTQDPGMTAVQRAKAVKVYMARGQDILSAVRKFDVRYEQPRKARESVLDAIVSAHTALADLYSEQRRVAQGELLRDAGL